MSALFRATRAADFDRLYRHHVPTVYRYAYAVLGNSADAEDVTQQTFLNAYRAIVQGTKPRKTENWLLTIAHNEVRRHFRANGKAVEVEFDDTLAQPAPDRSGPGLADVLRALQHLPPMQRSALVMREFEGRTYAEIADMLNVTQSALETLLFRARRGLAERLEGDLSCADAEQALSRRLDGRLARREGRRLKAHLHDCARCVRFAAIQKRQRGVLKGLSVMPIPASLLLFRGEHAAAAGLGGSAAAAAGSTAVGATGVATGVAVKAAAVAATAAVAGGAGYGVATRVDPLPKPEAKAVLAAPLPQRAQARRGELPAVNATVRSVGSAAARVEIPAARAKGGKPRAKKPHPAARRSAKQPGPRLVHAREKSAMPAASRRKGRPTAKAEDRGPPTRPQRGKRLGTVKRADPKPIRPPRRIEKTKPPRVVEPPAPPAPPPLGAGGPPPKKT